jgi:hypothetical protein
VNILAPNTVLVTTADLRIFKRGWPCSGIPEFVCVAFQFDSHGLCDINWFDNDGIYIRKPKDMDESAILALSEDAQDCLTRTKRENAKSARLRDIANIFESAFGGAQ